MAVSGIIEVKSGVLYLAAGLIEGNDAYIFRA